MVESLMEKLGIYLTAGLISLIITTIALTAPFMNLANSPAGPLAVPKPPPLPWRGHPGRVPIRCCGALLVLLATLPVGAATVTWTGGSGDWNTATNWSTGELPGPGDDVVIGSGASITVTHSSGAHTVQSLASQQAFQLTGGALTVSNTVQVNNTFTLSGGTLVQATVLQGTNGASLVVHSGTFDGVTVNGNWDVGSSVLSAGLTVLHGLTINGTLQVGNPTNTWIGTIAFSGSQTLGGDGTVVFGNDPGNALALVNANTLTIAPGITVRGQNGQIGYSGYFNVSVVNQGTISSDSGGLIAIIAQPLLNDGSVAMSDGGSLSINYMTNVVGLSASGNGTLALYGNWQNNQALSVSGGTLSLNGNWNNAATINATNALVKLGGTFTTANLGVLNQSNATVDLVGTLVNSNATLTLNAASGSWVLGAGTVQGGTIALDAGASLVVQGGTFDGVTVNGNWDVGSSAAGGRLVVLDGLTIHGTLQVGNPTNESYGTLVFSGSQTLAGDGTVAFGDSVNNALQVIYANDALTIAPGITVRGQSGQVGSLAGGQQNVSVINQGTISADVSGGAVIVTGQSLTNLGNLRASAGATLGWSGDLLLNGSQNPLESTGRNHPRRRQPLGQHPQCQPIHTARDLGLWVGPTRARGDEPGFGRCRGRLRERLRLRRHLVGLRCASHLG